MKRKISLYPDFKFSRSVMHKLVLTTVSLHTNFEVLIPKIWLGPKK